MVRLGGYYRQLVNTIEVLGAQTDPDHAHAIMIAATREDASTTDGLLATRTENREAGASR